MNVSRILYYIEKLFVVILTCFVASLLFKLIIYFPILRASNLLVIDFFEGVMGIFLYLLPLFIIWFFPIAFFIDDQSIKTKTDRLKTIKIQLYSCTILALVFTFVFDNRINLILLVIYFFISYITSVIFYHLNSIGNRIIENFLVQKTE